MSKLRKLNRDEIKYIAVFAMMLNHISAVFLQKGTFLGELFLDIGYFTAPVMIYFLVEGYFYTRSRKKYALRLFLFGLISQIPFYLALTPDGRFPGMLNMMFSLFFCFLIMDVTMQIHNGVLKFIFYLLLILVLSFCDWPTMSFVYTFLFADAYGSKVRLKKALVIATILFMIPLYMTNRMYFGMGKAFLLTGGSALGVLAAGFTLVYLYNGEKGGTGNAFSKWFFYLFYPVHLLILGLIRVF